MNEKPATNGDLIKQLREENGWTQDYLAEKAKVARSTVALAEAGKHTSPTTRRKIAEALGILPKRLLPENSFRKVA